MSKYQQRITKDGTGDFHALVVRIDRDGKENVCHGFGGYYKTRKGAERGCARYIAKMEG